MIKLIETPDRLVYSCETADEYDNLFIAGVLSPWEPDGDHYTIPALAVKLEARYWNRAVTIITAPALPSFRRYSDHKPCAPCAELCGEACPTCTRLRQFFNSPAVENPELSA